MNPKLTTVAFLAPTHLGVFRPQPVPVPVPVPIPRTPDNFPPPGTTQKQPQTLRPIQIEKRAPDPKPTLQDYLPTDIKGGKHRGLKAYKQAFPNLATEFGISDESDSQLNDDISIFWLDQLSPVLLPEGTISEQRQRLDAHLMKSVGKNGQNKENPFMSDNLKGKDLEQNIEYLRLAIAPLKESFKSEEDPGLESFRREYNPKDGTEMSEPEIPLSPKLSQYLKDRGINPVKVAIAIESVLSTRLSRLKSRSYNMENQAKTPGFLRP